MKKLLAFVLCCLCPALALAGDAGYKINYDGGSIQGHKAGEGMKLYIEGDHIRVVKDKSEVMTLPASSITEIRAC
jgi:tRNA pseudouridine-54 N-methylase